MQFDECVKSNCIKTQKWVRREILIGTNLYDKEFNNINSIDDLRKKRLLRKLKIYLENYSGGNINKSISRPTTRVINIISKKGILNRIKNDLKIFKFKQISKLKKNCFYLFDYL